MFTVTITKILLLLRNLCKLVKETVAELFSSVDEHYNEALVTRFSRVCTSWFRKFAGLPPE